MSISKKLKLIIMITSSVALLAACAAFITYDQLSSRRAMARDLSTLAKVIGTNSSAALAFSDPASAMEILFALKANPDVAGARLYSAGGEVFAEYVRDQNDDVFARREHQTTVSNAGGGYMVACEPVVLEGETIGTVCVVSDLSEIHARLRQFTEVVGLVLLGALLIALMVSAKLQKLISAPISHLAKTARTVSLERDYTIRAKRRGRDEMGTLIDTFNDMLTQIQVRDIELQKAQDELERRVEYRTLELQEEVAERKRAEAALKQSEEHFRSLIESASDIISILDLDGTIRYESPSVERVLGYTPAELLGRNVSEFAHPDEVPATKRLKAAARVPGGASAPIELRFRHRSGDWRVLEVVGRVVPDEMGVSRAIINSRDITDRKVWEQALTESEGKYRSILESIQEGYYEVDLRGNLTFFNESLSRIVGTPSEKLVGLNHRAYTSPETAESLRRAFSEVYTTGAPIENLQYEINTLEGARKFLETSVLLRRDSAGAVCGFRGTLRDITGRVQAEKALRESEQRYKTLFEAASDAILVVQAEGEDIGQVVDANRAAEEILGYSRDELLALNIKNLFFAPSKLEAAPQLEPMLAGERLNFEAEQRRKDGTVITVEMNSGPLLVGDRRYILGFARDITGRKQAEKEATMLAHAVRCIQESVAITDEQDTLLFVNDAFLSTYGYTRDEVIGANILELVRPPAYDPVSGAPIPPPKVRSRWEGELINRRKDGALFPISLSTSPIIDENGRTVAFGAVSQDITERRRVIAELQRAKEAAEAANRAKSEFLANMSHEIRTPMNGIIGMTDLALDTDLTAEQQEYLRLVRLSADSLLRVINDILDFSKIEAGKLRLDLDEFDLQDAVDEVMKALGVRADQKGIELAYYLRPGVPEFVVGDLGRLRQILVNLVGNAIKFTEAGDVVVRVEIESENEEEVVLRFSVRDTGVGVPPEKQSLIFDSFTQADGSTTRKYGGTGLGLTISRQLVAMMGGELWLESPVTISPDQPGPGSVFHFTAKFGRAGSAGLTRPPKDRLGDLEGLPVLIVDDNATNRRILEVQLSNWRMRPAAAATGTSALEMISNAISAGDPFKLALIDFHMPYIDGLDLTERIRQMPDGNKLAVIIMSSSMHPKSTDCADLGIAKHLLKPVKPADLLIAIDSALTPARRPDLKMPRATLRSERPSRILVAEDSSVNQTLMRSLLEKWGHTPVLARTGKAAVELMEANEFAAVLMDVQMPELNGLEATAMIRGRERGLGTRIPIIALTAHAMSGDRERCLEAGMDDYVAKPIDPDKLFETLEHILNQPEAGNNGNSRGRSFDARAVLNNFDGDLALVRKLARLFSDTSSEQLSDIRSAVCSGDPAAVARASHLLKGSVANFHAQSVVDAAARLEQIGRNQDLSAANVALSELEAEMARLRQDLDAFTGVTSIEDTDCRR